jgi:hypothetical protein
LAPGCARGRPTPPPRPRPPPPPAPRPAAQHCKKAHEAALVGGGPPPPPTRLAPDGGRAELLLAESATRARLFPLEEPDTKRHLPALCADRLRAAAASAAGPHGFAALRPGGGAAPPALQQLLAFTLQGAVDLTAEAGCGFDLQEWTAAAGAGFVPRLLYLLPPQLNMCLVADVAAGLLCPG